jgi:hypothetical protein
MKYEIGEAGEKAERDMIERAKMGSSVFHMGGENEISIVGQKLKRNTNSILGNELNRDHRFLGKV